MQTKAGMSTGCCVLLTLIPCQALDSHQSAQNGRHAQFGAKHRSPHTPSDLCWLCNNAPRVTTDRAWVSPRVNRELPCVRGRTLAREVMRRTPSSPRPSGLLPLSRACCLSTSDTTACSHTHCRHSHGRHGRSIWGRNSAFIPETLTAPLA